MQTVTEDSDADLHLLGGEGVLAQVQRLELVVGLEVRPAPDAAVDHVRQSFPVGHLQPPVQTSRYCDTLGDCSGITESVFQRLQGSFGLLQLLHKSVHGFLGPFLLLISLLPAQKSLDSWRCETEQRV